MSNSTGEQITSAVQSWPGVEAAPHRFGGIEFRLGRRELGHLHGDRIADLPFPRRVRDELIADGRARPHHVLPDSGWITTLDPLRRGGRERDSSCSGWPTSEHSKGLGGAMPDRSRIFVVTGDEVVRLTLTGSRADDVETVLTVPAPRSVAVDPHDPNRVYVGTFDDGLFATDDGGETWRESWDARRPARDVGRRLPSHLVAGYRSSTPAPSPATCTAPRTGGRPGSCCPSCGGCRASHAGLSPRVHGPTT